MPVYIFNLSFNNNKNEELGFFPLKILLDQLVSHTKQKIAPKICLIALTIYLN